MKLIDAEKFATGIALMKISFLESGDGKDTEYKRGAVVAMEAIRKVLEEAPTDYDPDEVVQQLEEASISLGDYPGFVVDIEKAIEIVEGGADAKTTQIRRKP